MRGNVELVWLSEAEGRVAAEGALPYPPGVLCVVPGEVWGRAVLRHFRRWKRASTCRPVFTRAAGYIAKRILTASSGCTANMLNQRLCAFYSDPSPAVCRERDAVAQPALCRYILRGWPILPYCISTLRKPPSTQCSR
ncbi:hypothetical protein DMH17_08020 [Raoultella planticola]|nr:hypothetical protein [Raoultella planticola]